LYLSHNIPCKGLDCCLEGIFCELLTTLSKIEAVILLDTMARMIQLELYIFHNTDIDQVNGE